MKLLIGTVVVWLVDLVRSGWWLSKCNCVIVLMYIDICWRCRLPMSNVDVSDGCWSQNLLLKPSCSACWRPIVAVEAKCWLLAWLLKSCFAVEAKYWSSLLKTKCCCWSQRNVVCAVEVLYCRCCLEVYWWFLVVAGNHKVEYGWDQLHVVEDSSACSVNRKEKFQVVFVVLKSLLTTCEFC